MDSLTDWLSKPPKFTTFRINKLRKFDQETLLNNLKSQSAELGTSEIPNVYFLKPDCLVLEQWPETCGMAVQEIVDNKEIIVDAACAAAVLRGAHVFAPGVLGMPPGCQKGDCVKIFGDLDGKCKRGLKVNFEGRKLLVGTGILKMTRRDLFDEGVQPSGIAIQTVMAESRLPIINETLYPKGDVLLQNLPSMVCGWVMDAKPNDVILDMCAAPGNKTTHLAEMSDNQAKIIALDKTPQKATRIKENCEAHGVTCVKVYAYDSTKCFSEDSKGIDEGPPFPENSFDKILLDAPCSGLGNRPQLKNNMSPKMLQSYKHVQRKLFDNAFKLLKPGGRLVYSTCTVTEEENEGMVSWALAQWPLRLVEATPLLGGPGRTSLDNRELVQRFGPEENPLRPADKIYRDTIGFFIASFTKIAE